MVDVPFDVDRLLGLWTDALPEDDDAASDAFRELYTDPVTVYGAVLSPMHLIGVLTEPGSAGP